MYYLASKIMSHYFYDLTHYRNILVQFLVQMKTLKFAPEINWPLVVSECNVSDSIGKETAISCTSDSFPVPLSEDCATIDFRLEGRVISMEATSKVDSERNVPNNVSSVVEF